MKDNNPRIKALIVDDERLAREEMRRMLGFHPELEIVGEAANGPDAIAAIQRLRPEAVFLDIQMPGLNGFEVVAALEPPVPWIVFVTAYDQHAIQAFQVNALDFIVKPADPIRLAASVERLVDRARVLQNHPGSAKQRLAESDRVFLREGERCWFVVLKELHLLESDGNYTRVHFGEGAALLPRSLSELENRLPEQLFFRANRAQIINTHAIAKVTPWFSNSLKVKLTSGIEVEFSRRAAQLFRERTSL
jgi:two-component system, LytTR family, response regulator